MYLLYISTIEPIRLKFTRPKGKFMTNRRVIIFLFTNLNKKFAKILHKEVFTFFNKYFHALVFLNPNDQIKSKKRSIDFFVLIVLKSSCHDNLDPIGPAVLMCIGHKQTHVRTNLFGDNLKK